MKIYTFVTKYDKLSVLAKNKQKAIQLANLATTEKISQNTDFTSEPILLPKFF